jgi:hypothetical protein
MTLGGLALAVGVLVDEATVEVENIHSSSCRASLGRELFLKPAAAPCWHACCRCSAFLQYLCRPSS